MKRIAAFCLVKIALLGSFQASVFCQTNSPDSDSSFAITSHESGNGFLSERQIRAIVAEELRDSTYPSWIVPLFSILFAILLGIVGIAGAMRLLDYRNLREGVEEERREIERIVTEWKNKLSDFKEKIETFPHDMKTFQHKLIEESKESREILIKSEKDIIEQIGQALESYKKEAKDWYDWLGEKEKKLDEKAIGLQSTLAKKHEDLSRSTEEFAQMLKQQEEESSEKYLRINSDTDAMRSTILETQGEIDGVKKEVSNSHETIEILIANVNATFSYLLNGPLLKTITYLNQEGVITDFALEKMRQMLYESITIVSLYSKRDDEIKSAITNLQGEGTQESIVHLTRLCKRKSESVEIQILADRAITAIKSRNQKK